MCVVLSSIEHNQQIITIKLVIVVVVVVIVIFTFFLHLAFANLC